MKTTFQIFAAYTSPISGAKVQFELVEQHQGVAFRNTETGKVELGTHTAGLASLDAFRRIFSEMSPEFELR